MIYFAHVTVHVTSACIKVQREGASMHAVAYELWAGGSVTIDGGQLCHDHHHAFDCSAGEDGDDDDDDVDQAFDNDGDAHADDDDDDEDEDDDLDHAFDSADWSGKWQHHSHFFAKLARPQLRIVWVKHTLDCT